MKRIVVRSSIRSEKWFRATAAFAAAGAVLAEILLECAEEKILLTAAIAALLYFLICVILWFTPTVVTYDREWLTAKHMVFKTEIRMSEISCARYYIEEYTGGRRPGSNTSAYRLVLSVECRCRKLKLKENIDAQEIEACKKGEANKDLLGLYEAIEECNPKIAKGYWRYCGV